MDYPVLPLKFKYRNPDLIPVRGHASKSNNSHSKEKSIWKKLSENMKKRGR